MLAIRRLQGLRQIEVVQNVTLSTEKISQEFKMMAVSEELLWAVADHRGLKELKIGGPALASFHHGEQFSCKLYFQNSHFDLFSLLFAFSYLLTQCHNFRWDHIEKLDQVYCA